MPERLFKGWRNGRRVFSAGVFGGSSAYCGGDFGGADRPPRRTFAGGDFPRLDFSIEVIAITQRQIASESSYDFTDRSHVYRIYVAAQTITDFQLGVSFGPDIPPAAPTWSSSDESIAVVDQIGNVVGLEPGYVTIAASTVYGTAWVGLEIAVTAAASHPELIGFAEGSVARAIDDAIEARIAGKSAGAKLVFSTQNHAGAHYVRNVDGWVYGIPAMPCASPWNTVSAQYWAGTAVTPRHVIFARHAQVATGATLRFVTADNQIVTRTMTHKGSLSGDGYNADFTIGVLDADLPASVPFAKILPENVAAKLPIIEGVPAFGLDQEEKAVIFDHRTEAEWIGAGNAAPISFQYPPINSARYAFSEALISGDSGNPVFTLIGEELVILSVWTYGGAGAGSSVRLLQAQLNALIDAVDAAAGISTGYELTPIDLSAYASFDV